MHRLKVHFSKPIYAGFTILDISKIVTYDFHYNYIKANFGNRAKLLYTDADSLLYELQVPDLHQCMKKDITKFDTSDYPPNNVYNMPLCKKKMLGLMKDECCGKIVSEFIGLWVKLYTFKIFGDNREKKKAKGVKGSTLKTINFEDYRDSLNSHKNLKKPQFLIQSKKHQVYTIQQNKIALSKMDDKRQLLSGTTDTRP